MVIEQLPPWKRRKAAGKRAKTPLTEAQKNAARARAEKAGRRYPNLVDNMWAAKLKPDGQAPSGRDPEVYGPD